MMRRFVLFFCIFISMSITANAQRQTLRTIAYGEIIRAEFPTNVSSVSFQFEASFGDVVVLEVAATGWLSDLYPEIRVQTERGTTLIDSSELLLSILDSTKSVALEIPQDGTYIIVITQGEYFPELTSAEEFELKLIQPEILKFNEQVSGFATSETREYFVVISLDAFSIYFTRNSGNMTPYIEIIQLSNNNMDEVVTLEGNITHMSLGVPSVRSNPVYLITVRETLFNFSIETERLQFDIMMTAES